MSTALRLRNRLFSNSGALGIVYSFLLGLLIRHKAILYPASTDWDEDGFISIGKMLALRGQLPFVDSYEHKPPLNYVLYSLPFVSNLDSTRFVQVFPLLIVSFAGFFLSMAIKQERNLIHQVVTTTILIVLVSIFPNGLGWMTEINAILVICLAFWIIRIPLRSSWSCFLVGFVLALLPFMRTNLGIPALFLFFSYLITDHVFREKIHIVVLGCLSPLLLTSIPYLLSNRLDALLKGMLEIHFVSDRFGSNIDFLFGKTRFILILAVLAFLYTSLKENRLFNRGSRRIWMVNSLLDKPFLLAFGITFSIFIDVPNYGHHLLQAIPGIVFIFLRIVSSAEIQYSLPVLFVLFFSIGFYMVQTNVNSARIAASERTDVVVSCVEAQMTNSKTAWVLNDIFLYWQTDLKPVDPLVIHPITLMLPEFLEVFPDQPLSQHQGVNRIFSKNPELVVFSPESWFLTANIREQFQFFLKEKYQEQSSCGIRNFKIYKIND